MLISALLPVVIRHTSMKTIHHLYLCYICVPLELGKKINTSVIIVNIASLIKGTFDDDD